MKALIILTLLTGTCYADLTPDQLAVELGQSVNMPARIEVFLRNHHVRTPKRFARIICQQVSDPEQAKMWAAKLVPEKGDRGQISIKGCVGPWQVNYKVWPDLCRGKDITDPATNLRIARKIWRWHLSKSGRVWGKGGAVDCYSGCAQGYWRQVRKLTKEI